jgi:hypothetical protein
VSGTWNKPIGRHNGQRVKNKLLLHRFSPAMHPGNLQFFYAEKGIPLLGTTGLNINKIKFFS